MAPSSRKRKETVAPPVWSRSKRLSTYDLKWQPLLYRGKIDKVDDPLVCEKPVVVDDFRGFGVVEKFEYLGWEACLTYCYQGNTSIYTEEIKQWLATLKRIPGPNPSFTTTLKGKVHGVDVVLTMEALSNMASFDSGIKAPGATYESLTDDDILCTEGPEWLDMVRELFDFPGDARHYKPLLRKDLRPPAYLISKIMFSNIMPRRGDHSEMRKYEVKALYALVTGRVRMSLRQLIMLNNWESRETQLKSFIPHCRLLTHMLDLANVIPRNAAEEFHTSI